MLLGARQFFERRGAHTPPLPYDYAVEYIETDGVASYIDTGCYAGQHFRYDIDFQVVSRPVSSASAAGCVCGANSASGTSGRYFDLFISTNRDVFHFANPSSSSTTGPAFNLNRHTASCSYDGLGFDGETVGITSSNVYDRHSPFYIGKDGEYPTSSSYPERSYANVRIFSCILSDNGVVVFNGIPVVANGAAGLYDSISGTFKGNAAESGTITAGPRV